MFSEGTISEDEHLNYTINCFIFNIPALRHKLSILKANFTPKKIMADFVMLNLQCGLMFLFLPQEPFIYLTKLHITHGEA